MPANIINTNTKLTEENILKNLLLFALPMMAAFAAAVKIDTLAYMPAQESGNAYPLFISQNYGAKKNERIQKGTKTAYHKRINYNKKVIILLNEYDIPLQKT